jgi:uncharacterized protein (TIRG00374 family)
VQAGNGGFFNLGSMTTTLTSAVVDAQRVVAPSRRWPKMLALAVITTGLVYLLVRRVGGWAFSPGTLLAASPEWVVACAGATLGTYAASAAAMAGATTVRLRAGDTVGVQFAATMSNRFVPGGAAGTVLRARFVERSGGTRGQAVATLAMLTAAAAVVRLIALLTCAAFFWTSPRRPALQFPPLIWAIVGGTVAVTLVMVARARSSIAARIRNATRSTTTELRLLLRTPRRLIVVLAGAGGVLMCHAFALAAATRAVGLHVAMPAVVLAYLTAATAAALSPLPAGLGALDLALAGALAVEGAGDAKVVAAVLLYRLVTFWLPFAPGYLSMRSMRRRGFL